MTRVHDRDRLGDMRAHAAEAVALLNGRRRADLAADRVLALALTRLLEIVGEAAARITVETRQRHEEIPWADIVGLRNRLIHGYGEVDLNILWDIVHDDLPSLISVLDDILRALSRER